MKNSLTQKVLFLTSVFFIFSTHSNFTYAYSSTYTNTILSSDTLRVCEGASVQLTGSTNVSGSYSWSPSTGLSDTNTRVVTATPSASTTYKVSTTSEGSNQISNPWSNFTTDLTRIYFGSLDEGKYAIGRNPNSFHRDFPNCSSSTDYMFVNGATTADSRVWCRSFNLKAATEYTFSFDFAHLAGYKEQLIIKLNGNTISPTFEPPTYDQCVWINAAETFTTNNAGSYELCISNLQGILSGNDFAINNLSLNELIVQNDSIRVEVAHEGADYLTEEVSTCEENSYTFAINYGGNGTVSWAGPNGFSANGNTATVSNVDANSTGEYTLSINEDGCIHTETINLVSISCGPTCNNTINPVFGTVYLDDKTVNGIQDSDETGVAGVQVYAYDSNGGLIATKTTDSKGAYYFEDIDTNIRTRIEFNIPTGMRTSSLGEDNKSNVQFVLAGECNASLGLIQLDDDKNDNIQYFGNRVWVDEDGNGVQDADEDGYAGLKVYLFQGENILGVAFTDDNGIYSLSPILDLNEGETYSLVLGDISVPFIFNGEELFNTTTSAGDNSFIDNDATTDVTRYGGQPFIDVTYSSDIDLNQFDFGLTTSQSSSVSGQLFVDCDKDGLFSIGENTLAGVEIKLDNQTTTTDNEGKFDFEVEKSGTYSLELSDNIPNDVFATVVPTTGDKKNVLLSTFKTTEFQLVSGDKKTFYLGLQDTVGPTFVALPDDIQLSCDEEFPTESTLTASDNISGNVTVTFRSLESRNSEGILDSVLNIWEAVDECGNKSSHFQSIKKGSKLAVSFDVENLELCAGEAKEIAVNTTSGQSPYTFEWSSSRNIEITSTDNKAIINSNIAGTYTLEATITDATGCTETIELPLQVKDVSLTISGDSVYCVGEEISLIATGSSNIEWTLPDGTKTNTHTISIESAAVSHTGTYIATIDEGACKTTKQVRVQVQNSNDFELTANSPVCKGTQIKLSTNISNAESYSWSGARGFSSNESNPVIETENLDAGTYNYTAIVEQGGCILKESITVQVQDVGNIDFPSSKQVCEGSSVTFTASGAESFVWTGPAGFTHEGNTITLENVTAAQAGEYQVFLKENSGCQANSSFNLDIITASYLVVDVEDYNCQNNTMKLVTNITNPSSIIWTGPNGFRSSEISPTVTNVPENGGLYQVTVVGKGCQVFKNITILPSVLKGLSARITEENCTTNNGSIEITLPENITSFQWNGLPANTSLNRKNVTGGTYHLTIKNSECERTVSYIVPFNCDNEEELDTDGDGINDNDDLDDDNDGIADSLEGDVDTDLDGIIDRLDLDADGDGISDIVENGNRLLDIDFDGRLTLIDENGNGLHDPLEDAQNVLDFDNDGYPNFKDLDSDNDGIPDIVEEGLIDLDGDRDAKVNFNDANSDGLDDIITVQINFDSDIDGLPNRTDLDSDNDGITDLIEYLSTSVPYAESILDANKNGFIDFYEAKYNQGLNASNIDNDELPDYLDINSDNDEETDNLEAYDNNNDGALDLIALNGDADNDGLDDAYDAINGPDATEGGEEATDYPDLDNPGNEPDWREANIKKNSDLEDADKDGIPDVVEGDDDTDGDGVPNYLDLDSDNDGILDVVENGGKDDNLDGEIDDPTTQIIITPDVDGDGIPNYLDLDSDNDGILDIVENIPSTEEITLTGQDDNNNGIDNVFEGNIKAPVNIDEDLIPDYLDLDTDNDNELDYIEGNDTDNDGISNPLPSGIDTDNDGIDNSFDDLVGFGVTENPKASNHPNHDHPETDERDWREKQNPNLDSDNDGIADRLEGNIDTDKDGISDYLDIDSDNDGILDIIEAGGTDSDNDGKNDSPDNLISSFIDTDEDGIPNHLDIDSDNDGILDMVEALPSDESFLPTGLDDNNNGWDNGFEEKGIRTPHITNLDKGIPDYINLDSDGDEMPDLIEGHDFDGDLRAEDEPFGLDADQDGLDDSFDRNIGFDPYNGGKPTAADRPDISNIGGEPDWRELNTAFQIDSDNDGIPDEIEGQADTDEDGVPDYLDLDSDNDGIADVVEAGGKDDNNDGLLDEGESKIINPIDTDADLVPNHLDIDADNDGISDLHERLPTKSPIKRQNVDANNNGIDDGFEPLIKPITTADIGEPDYLNLDSDNDGESDNIEAFDNNNDGIADIAPAGSDDDFDGLDDAYDNEDGGYNPDNGVSPSDADYPDHDTPGDEPDWREYFENEIDTDQDGIPDAIDVDDDNDGIPDIIEGTNDTDGDGIPNHLDIDSDNDGILDIEEIGFRDENGNNIVDEFIDEDNNGLHDKINFGVLTQIDFDNDGKPNYVDIDSDNDGILDIIEGHDSDFDIELSSMDTDGDGLDDVFDNVGEQKYSNPINTDDDDEPDFLDLDADNDGDDDNMEAYDFDNDGVIDLSMAELDSDNDGYDDIYDNKDGFFPADDNRRNARTYPDLDNEGGEPDWRQAKSDETEEEIDEDLVAIDDEVFVAQNKTVAIDVTANDKYDSFLDDVDFMSNPKYGTITMIQNSFNYTPAEDVCDVVDTVHYFIEKGGKRDTAAIVITIDCEKVLMMTGISPNGDGFNDALNIKGIEQYPDNRLKIFNRYGNEVYSIKGYTNEQEWKGTFQDKTLLPDGTYFYVLELADEDNNIYSGYLQIAR